MSKIEDQSTALKGLLQRSLETRMRAIRERVSITSVFCSVVEFEIRYGHLEEARNHLQKLHTTVDRLTSHVSDPEHVSGEMAKEFKRQIVGIGENISFLESQLADKVRTRADERFDFDEETF